MNNLSAEKVNEKEPKFYAEHVPAWSNVEQARTWIRSDAFEDAQPLEKARHLVALYALEHVRIYKTEPTELYKAGEARKAVDAALSLLCEDFGNNTRAAAGCVMFVMAKAKWSLNNGKGERWPARWVFSSSKAADYRMHLAQKGEKLPARGESFAIGEDSKRDRVDHAPGGRPGPMIVVRPGSLSQLVDQAMELVADDPSLFVNSDRLVTIGETGIVDVSIDMLLARLTGAARWVREVEMGEDKVKEADIDCPLGIAKAVFSAKNWPKAKRLVGIVDHPLMRPDGTILDVPGYDMATGYFYQPSFDVPEVPKSPTHEQAKESLERLSDLFCDFHYQNPAQRIVGIAAILTLVGRSAIEGPVPAFFFDAPDKASGKTLHLETISRITTGKDSVAAEFCADVKEQSKRFVGWAREGALGIFADNLKTGSHFGSEVIDRHLTATRVDGRSLGKTGQIKYDWRAVIVVSGNNVQVRDETARRTIIARLYPLPAEKKDFKHDLRREAVDNRGRFIADALTVLRYHATQNRPKGERRDFASFERWQSVVADAIVSAGGNDPVEFCADNDPNQCKADPDIAALIMLVRNWHTLTRPEIDRGEPGVSARTLAQRIWPQSDVAGTDAEDLDMSAENMTRSESIKELGDALLDPTFLFDPRNGWTKGPSKLGVWFRKVKEKAVAGRLVFDEEQPASVKTWRLVNAKTSRDGVVLWTIRADGDDPRKPTPPLVLQPSEPKPKRGRSAVAVH